MATTDKKPVAVGGPVMRRTNQHILSNNGVTTFNTGDTHRKFPMTNQTQLTFPDSDPRWGLSPDSPDYPE